MKSLILGLLIAMDRKYKDFYLKGNEIFIDLFLWLNQ